MPLPVVSDKALVLNPVRSKAQLRPPATQMLLAPAARMAFKSACNPGVVEGVPPVAPPFCQTAQVTSWGSLYMSKSTEVLFFNQEVPATLDQKVTEFPSGMFSWPVLVCHPVPPQGAVEVVLP